MTNGMEATLLALEEHMQPPVAKARPLAGQRPEAFAQAQVVGTHTAAVAHGATCAPTRRQARRSESW